MYSNIIIYATCPAQCQLISAQKAISNSAKEYLHHKCDLHTFIILTISQTKLL